MPILSSFTLIERDAVVSPEPSRVREMFLARLEIAIEIGFEIERHFAKDFTTPISISIAIPIK